MAVSNFISAELPVDVNGGRIQTLTPKTNIADDVDASSDRVAIPVAAVPGEIIRIACNEDCYINFGNVSVTAAASNYLFVAGVEYFRVPEDAGYVAYVRVATSGRISVTHMA
jgi:hypothetical protein